MTPCLTAAGIHQVLAISSILIHPPEPNAVLAWSPRSETTLACWRSLLAVLMLVALSSHSPAAWPFPSRPRPHIDDRGDQWDRTGDSECLRQTHPGEGRTNLPLTVIPANTRQLVTIGHLPAYRYQARVGAGGLGVDVSHTQLLGRRVAEPVVSRLRGRRPAWAWNQATRHRLAWAGSPQTISERLTRDGMPALSRQLNLPTLL